MTRIRVHELAKELGKQNREIMELLRAEGIDVKSHMSNVEESQAAVIRKKIKDLGREKDTKLETPKTEEKVVTAKTDAEKTEAPKKKKNIIRVYHAQNASDGGKGRKKPLGEKRQRPQGARPAQPRSQAVAPAKPAAAKPAENVKPAESAKPVETAKSSAAPVQAAKPAEAKPAESRQGSDRPRNEGSRPQGAGRGEGRPAGNSNGQSGRGFRGNDNRNGERRSFDRQGGGRPQRNGDSTQRNPRFGEAGGRPARSNEGRPSRHRVQAEEKAVRIIVITEVKEEETDVSAREEADSVRVQEEAQVLPIQYLLQNLPKAPRTASVSVTEKIKTKRKILIRQVADTDQTRVAVVWYPDCQRHFRSWLPSRNSRKRKNSLK